MSLADASMDCKTTTLESRGTALPTHAGKNGNESLKTLALRGVLSGDAGLVSSNYLKSDPHLWQRVPHASTNDRLAPDRLHLFTSAGFANIQTKEGMEGIFYSLRFPLRTIFGA
ncbi:hypothetical protein HYQ44_009161 [Verticillium longisporum]|nr:hypothetical protein HYQ44_009161 [Verticillium longisporum]